MNRNIFYDFIFIVLAILTLFTGLSVFSYNPLDPSFSMQTIGEARNVFGKAGAYYSDILGFIAGWVAIVLPFALFYTLALFFRHYRGRLSAYKAVRGIFCIFVLLFALAMFSGIKGGEDFFFDAQPAGGAIGITSAKIIGSVLGKVGAYLLSVLLGLAAFWGIASLPSARPANRAGTESQSKSQSAAERLRKYIALKKESRRIRQDEEAQKRANRLARQMELLEAEETEEEEAKSFVRHRHELSSAAAKEEDIIIHKVHDEGLGFPEPQVLPEEPRHNVKRAAPFRKTIEDDELPKPEDYPRARSVNHDFSLDDVVEIVSKSASKYDYEDEDDEPGIADFVGTVPKVSGKAIVNAHDYSAYRLSEKLLEDMPDKVRPPDSEELKRKAEMLLAKLRDFGVDGRVREIRPGPVVTLYEFEPAPGIKINKISNLENDLALAMSAISIRIIAPIPGKSVVGIEIPNRERMMVGLKELIEAKEFKESESPLAIVLGKDISGRPYFSDLRKMPHMLVAGTTGSGKSVCINTIICSILYKSAPDMVKFVMIDPKMVELSVYEGIPHLAAPVVTDPRKASAVLQNVVKEMENRYSLLAACKVRSIDSYNNYIQRNSSPELTPMSYMVVIVDEFADLMMVAGKEVESSIIRIAQMARAVGIHLVLATQRPSVNVITGIIKANMPARISFKVSSKIDSRTILDQNGAELLLGRGDSLFIPPGSSDTLRIHGAFVSEDEVLRVVDALKIYGEPEYDMTLLHEENAIGALDEDEEIDSRYDEALALVREKGFASISMIQRYLRIGYNRAARIVETMERQGLIGTSDGTSKPRELL